MTKRKFYETIITVKVLSEEPIEMTDLETLAYQINEGYWCGEVSTGKSTPLDGSMIVQELNSMGSEASFFRLDEAGNDSQEEDPHGYN